MSLIGRVPYIQKLINDLNDQQRADLAAKLNNVVSQNFRSFVDENYFLDPLNDGEYEIEPVYLQLEVNKTIGGMLVRANDNEHLLAYDSSQMVRIYKLNSANRTYELVNEYCDINELRDVLDRSLMPKAIYATNIQELTDDQLDSLKCGDMVIKITAQNDHVYRHTYVVSYKEHHVGICMSYSAAGLVETVSYDYTDGHWVYNSTDKATF